MRQKAPNRPITFTLKLTQEEHDALQASALARNTFAAEIVRAALEMFHAADVATCVDTGVPGVDEPGGDE